MFVFLNIVHVLSHVHFHYLLVCMFTSCIYSCVDYMAYIMFFNSGARLRPGPDIHHEPGYCHVCSCPRHGRQVPKRRSRGLALHVAASLCGLFRLQSMWYLHFVRRCHRQLPPADVLQSSAGVQTQHMQNLSLSHARARTHSACPSKIMALYFLTHTLCLAHSAFPSKITAHHFWWKWYNSAARQASGWTRTQTISSTFIVRAAKAALVWVVISRALFLFLLRKHFITEFF